MQTLVLTMGWIVTLFVGLAGLIILYYMAVGKIDLQKLISEANGDASMSRFQLLIFTFVISMSLFLVTVGHNPVEFPATIPPEILTLLGISGGSYLISKGIQSSKETTNAKIAAENPSQNTGCPAPSAAAPAGDQPAMG